MSRDTEKAIEEILNDFERQPIQDKRTFRAYLNNPELVLISSANAQQQSPPISPMTYNQYYNFTVNLPRPALEVKSLQILKTVIPQAQCSIPDYSLVFPYYKLRTLPVDDIGQVHFVDAPSFSRLYYVRLLPSYYKPELLYPSYLTQAYGFNTTFNDYEELVAEINKGCLYNLPFTAEDHFIADDVEFYYDKKLNKIIFRGLNANTRNVYPTFDFGSAYVPGDVVDYQDGDDLNTYLCLIQTDGDYSPAENFPPGTWLNTSQFSVDNYNAYLIGGYNDPIVKQLLQYVELESTTQDFLTIASIPGNKYVEGQTLARRMGFTWDGTGMIYDLDTLNRYYNTGISFGGTSGLFYNRFRQIPTYLPEGLRSFLTASATGSADTYTADGYCNLVYSSITNIYTNIIGTSSVDSQRNANLLAMVEMNCGNLGVAMIGNYIDTSLTKIQSDIYSVYIELRDENSEPYYLTNNATTNFLFKLTY